MYTIEKNIPIEDIKLPNLRKEFLLKMEIGDSLLDSFGSDVNWHAAARSLGYKVRTKKVSKNETRIWRVA